MKLSERAGRNRAPRRPAAPRWHGVPSARPGRLSQHNRSGRDLGARRLLASAFSRPSAAGGPATAAVLDNSGNTLFKYSRTEAGGGGSEADFVPEPTVEHPVSASVSPFPPPQSTGSPKPGYHPQPYFLRHLRPGFISVS